MALNWLKAPADREVIRRWTAPAGGTRYRLEIPQPADPERFEFLVLGDTGDSEASGPGVSPQDAVGKWLALDAAPPVGKGQGLFVLHTGDIVYMTGERRLYDRNFRRPYAPFLAAESTVDNLVFRLPFLPVPGNHDYYDLAGWARAVAGAPIVGGGLRALAREVFAYSIPRGGSDMGAAYMEAFVGPNGTYVPGTHTRIPNRYYCFRAGAMDVMALDSNTLQAPAPAKERAQVRSDAAERIRELEARARALDRELRGHQLALERLEEAARERLIAHAAGRAELTALGRRVGGALGAVGEALGGVVMPGCMEAAVAAEAADTEWRQEFERLTAARGPDAARRALRGLDRATRAVVRCLEILEGCLGLLPEGRSRRDLLTARAMLERRFNEWCRTLCGEAPPELRARIEELSETALDVQRDLAQEKSRRRYTAEDHDSDQLAWLAATLDELERERPDGWRVVFFHHPLLSTIRNHCEHAEVREVRDNLLPLLRGRVHLILTGHSHAFEWIRTELLPHTGLFVTGGGGQVTLRSSILAPHYFPRYKDRYQSLCRAGAVECAVAGKGPGSGFLYHYLRVQVTPGSLRVIPIGVRRLNGGYQREEPLPVFHAGELPGAAGWMEAGREHPGWEPRRLTAVEIRRGQCPRPVWG
jgi:3',5'-cyclic AMP phosphodiesterase CpdA